MLKNAEGKAEKMMFIGRSQVNKPGTRWVGDRITLMMATKRVLAEGNTRAYIMQQGPAKKPEENQPAQAQTQLAGRVSPVSISASHVEPTMTILTIDHIQKSYGGRRVVDDVSFNVNRGEVVGLLGATAPGKPH